MPRISVKIVGASGQGINSIGAIVAKGLKRSGYCVFGYREYPSLIKGGHASYQLDVSNERIRSTETKVNLLVALNHHGLELNIGDLKERGIVLHVTPGWQFPERHQKLIKERSLRVIYFPVNDILTRLGAKAILSNVLLTAFVWSMFEQDIEMLKSLVGEKFAKKTALLELNMRCLEEGYAFVDPGEGRISVPLPSPKKDFSCHLLVTGSQAMGLGAIHAGVRLYAGYPMTPSSALLSFMADLENKTHMVVKQAEDEITAAQMVSGAMYMGTRALTATSGVGFDLMSETVSLNGMIENPTVFVLAQRPGPATGLPTWTAQGALLQAVNTSAGEFARCVLSVSDAKDSFSLMPDAFNIAEEYQLSVIILTDKQIAEALYTEPLFDQSKTEIRRGTLVTDSTALNNLKAADRFDPGATDGISPRWLPGTEAATWNAQGDEHGGDGTVDESSRNAKAQMEKRMRKLEALKRVIPGPEVYEATTDELRITRDDGAPDILLIGWGSTKSVVLDVLAARASKPAPRNPSVGYLHYTYLWPLKTERLMTLAKRATKIVLVEQNYQGQLGQLIRMECGLHIPDRLLKYDGRPFFFDELHDAIETRTKG